MLPSLKKCPLWRQGEINPTKNAKLSLKFMCLHCWIFKLSCRINGHGGDCDTSTHMSGHLICTSGKCLVLGYRSVMFDFYGYLPLEKYAHVDEL